MQATSERVHREELRAVEQERDAAWRTIRQYAADLGLLYAPEADIVSIAAMVGARLVKLEQERDRLKAEAALADEAAKELRRTQQDFWLNGTTWLARYHALTAEHPTQQQPEGAP